MHEAPGPPLAVNVRGERIPIPHKLDHPRLARAPLAGEHLLPHPPAKRVVRYRHCYAGWQLYLPQAIPDIPRISRAIRVGWLIPIREFRRIDLSSAPTALIIRILRLVRLLEQVPRRDLPLAPAPAWPRIQPFQRLDQRAGPIISKHLPVCAPRRLDKIPDPVVLVRCWPPPPILDARHPAIAIVLPLSLHEHCRY